MPPTSDEYLRYTTEQLYIEFYEDWFEAHPNEAITLNGEDVVFKTGDPLIDKWEEELARGEQPNLDEFFTPEENAALEAVAAAAEASEADDGDSKAVEPPAAPPKTGDSFF